MKHGDILKKHNLKQTQARSAILTIIFQSKKPVDVVTISQFLKKIGIVTDQATVYRTLQTFVESGILKRVEFHEGKFRYELSSLPHHHHLVCTDCGKIEDIENCGMEEVEKILQKKTSFKIAEHHAEFFGFCKNCKRSTQAAKAQT
ncbi:transcriptional repressor [Candidatus Roizmanbacteria bacterium]|jgi:Fur family ferric uptake transcriptional regulator|nr:MAG: transcriptional repressor [Candidatus Roizmanbacteria bacterium]